MLSQKCGIHTDSMGYNHHHCHGWIQFFKPFKPSLFRQKRQATRALTLRLASRTWYQNVIATRTHIVVAFWARFGQQCAALTKTDGTTNIVKHESLMVLKSDL